MIKGSSGMGLSKHRKARRTSKRSGTSGKVKQYLDIALNKPKLKIQVEMCGSVRELLK